MITRSIAIFATPAILLSAWHLELAPFTLPWALYCLGWIPLLLIFSAADKYTKEKSTMQLSTVSSATFNDWFATLKQIAMHDYNLTIKDQEQGEYVEYYTGGLNQNEALGA